MGKKKKEINMKDFEGFATQTPGGRDIRYDEDYLEDGEIKKLAKEVTELRKKLRDPATKDGDLNKLWNELSASDKKFVCSTTDEEGIDAVFENILELRTNAIKINKAMDLSKNRKEAEKYFKEQIQEPALGIVEQATRTAGNFSKTATLYRYKDISQVEIEAKMIADLAQGVNNIYNSEKKREALESLSKLMDCSYDEKQKEKYISEIFEKLDDDDDLKRSRAKQSALESLKQTEKSQIRLKRFQRRVDFFEKYQGNETNPRIALQAAVDEAQKEFNAPAELAKEREQMEQLKNELSLLEKKIDTISALTEILVKKTNRTRRAINVEQDLRNAGITTVQELITGSKPTTNLFQQAFSLPNTNPQNVYNAHVALADDLGLGDKNIADIYKEFREKKQKIKAQEDNITQESSSSETPSDESNDIKKAKLESAQTALNEYDAKQLAALLHLEAAENDESLGDLKARASKKISTLKSSEPERKWLDNLKKKLEEDDKFCAMLSSTIKDSNLTYLTDTQNPRKSELNSSTLKNESDCKAAGTMLIDSITTKCGIAEGGIINFNPSVDTSSWRLNKLNNKAVKNQKAINDAFIRGAIAKKVYINPDVKDRDLRKKLERHNKAVKKMLENSMSKDQAINFVFFPNQVQTEASVDTIQSDNTETTREALHKIPSDLDVVLQAARETNREQNTETTPTNRALRTITASEPTGDQPPRSTLGQDGVMNGQGLGATFDMAAELRGEQMRPSSEQTPGLRLG